MRLAILWGLEMAPNDLLPKLKNFIKCFEIIKNKTIGTHSENNFYFILNI